MTETHYGKLAKVDMAVVLAPVWAERLLTILGLEGRLRYRLRPTGDWHHFDVHTRTVEMAGPTCTVLELLHELAHWWEPRHNGRHLMALELLTRVWEELE